MSVTAYGFPTRWRLKRRSDIRRVFARKCSVGDRHLVLYVVPNAFEFNRLGLSVGRRLGNAVVRNRLKRLIREAFRLQQLATTCPGHDLMCIPRPGPPRSRATYEQSLARLLRQGVERLERRHDARGT